MWKNKNKTKKKYVLVEEGNLSKKKMIIKEELY